MLIQEGKMDENNKLIVKIDQDLEDLIPQFMENTKKDIDSINEALLKNDLETIRRMGHSMKSYGSGYGFDYISTAGKSIEAAAVKEDLPLIKQAVKELINYLDEVKVVYV
jgi:HPt (histidine-containing phosphotransfer) domain-containing protein